MIEQEHINALSQEEKEFVYKEVRRELFKKALWEALETHYHGEEELALRRFTEKDIDKFTDRCLKCDFNQPGSIQDNLKWGGMLTNWEDEFDCAYYDRIDTVEMEFPRSATAVIDDAIKVGKITIAPSKGKVTAEIGAFSLPLQTPKGEAASSYVENAPEGGITKSVIEALGALAEKDPETYLQIIARIKIDDSHFRKGND